jgi:hypothetical protein
MQAYLKYAFEHCNNLINKFMHSLERLSTLEENYFELYTEKSNKDRVNSSK